MDQTDNRSDCTGSLEHGSPAMQIRHPSSDSGVPRRTNAAESYAEPLGPASTAGSPTARQGQEAAARVGSDRLDLSECSQRLARSPCGNEARRERVEELRTAYQAGELNTPERIEKAARRLLGGS